MAATRAGGAYLFAAGWNDLLTGVGGGGHEPHCKAHVCANTQEPLATFIHFFQP